MPDELEAWLLDGSDLVAEEMGSGQGWNSTSHTLTARTPSITWKNHGTPNGGRNIQQVWTNIRAGEKVGMGGWRGNADILSLTLLL